MVLLVLKQIETKLYSQKGLRNLYKIICNTWNEHKKDHTVKNNFVGRHVKLRNRHNFVVSARFQ